MEILDECNNVRISMYLIKVAWKLNTPTYEDPLWLDFFRLTLKNYDGT